MGNLANKLSRKLRTLRGDMTQVEFARKLGISKSSLNRIEIGQQNVTLDTLELLCDRLKCSVGDLFETDQTNPKRR